MFSTATSTSLELDFFFKAVNFLNSLAACFFPIFPYTLCISMKAYYPVHTLHYVLHHALHHIFHHFWILHHSLHHVLPHSYYCYSFYFYHIL